MTQKDKQALLRVRSQARLVQELRERLEDTKAAIGAAALDGMPRGKGGLPRGLEMKVMLRENAGGIAEAGRKAAARLRKGSAGGDDRHEERRICILLILLHLRDEFGGHGADHGQMRAADSAIQAGD